MRTFFMTDENFLLYKKRALELLRLMNQQRKSWSMFVFASANAIRKYELRQLVELGISWVWMGLESAQTDHDKPKGSRPTKFVFRARRSSGWSITRPLRSTPKSPTPSPTLRS